jgi:uncharacterized protein (TIGR02118 family)
VAEPGDEAQAGPAEGRLPIEREPDARKLMVAFRRAGGTSVDEFRRRLDADSSSLLDAVGHIRSTTTATGYGYREPIYDAVDEIWFENESTVRLDRLAAMLDALGVDPASVATFLVRDHLIQPGPTRPGMLKNFEFVTRRPDLTKEQFRRYWREHHGPLATGIGPMGRYVQSHTVDAEYVAGEPSWEGSAITWFDDLEAMRASGDSAAYVVTRADEKNFLGAPLALPFIITTERVLAAADDRRATSPKS